MAFHDKLGRYAGGFADPNVTGQFPSNSVAV